MRQCEYKKKYDSDLGKYVYKHVYGEGIFDSIKNLGREFIGTTSKKAVSNVAKKSAKTALNKTGNYVGNMAGDKIISLLHGNKEVIHDNIPRINESNKLSEYEINERVNQLLGSGIRKKRMLSNIII